MDLLQSAIDKAIKPENTTAFDAFARFNFNTFGLRHRLVAGFNYIDGDTNSYFASTGSTFNYQFIGNSTPPRALAPVDTYDYSLSSKENGYYVQDAIQFWKLHLLGALRYTDYKSSIIYNGDPGPSKDYQHATTPSFGAVFDITKNISVFGNYVRGFSPSFSSDFAGNRIPNIITRNVEGGVKLDLFKERFVVNASYFDLMQSNITIADPLHPGYQIAGPGKEGKGIDLNASGVILPGWTVQASFTHTNSKPLTIKPTGNIVQGSPKDQYSAYTAYEHFIGGGITAGLSAGFYGRSSAAVDTNGQYYVPASKQVDINTMLKWRGLNVNLGIRNLFDRRNLGLSFTQNYIPYAEPRTVRLTVGYRFR